MNVESMLYWFLQYAYLAYLHTLIHVLIVVNIQGDIIHYYTNMTLCILTLIHVLIVGNVEGNIITTNLILCMHTYITYIHALYVCTSMFMPCFNTTRTAVRSKSTIAPYTLQWILNFVISWMIVTHVLLCVTTIACMCMYACLQSTIVTLFQWGIEQ